MEDMDTEADIGVGAKQIVRCCLVSSKEHLLLMFADDPTSETASIVADAVEELSVWSTIVFIPIFLQRCNSNENDLSLIAQGVVREAHAIFTCANASPNRVSFRRRILELQWIVKTWIDLLPAAGSKVWKPVNLNFNELITNYYRLKIVLARGRNLELVSHAQGSKPHRPVVAAGGWERLPVASDGVMADRVWRNVPAAEIYSAPLAGGDQSNMDINGSIPDVIVRPSEQKALHFDRDRWNLGLHSATACRAGHMEFDEKAAGTAHIAHGSNTFMGERVESVIQCEMVIKALLLFAHGKTIFQYGKPRKRDLDLREEYRELSLTEEQLRAANEVSRPGIEATSQNQLLSRNLQPEPVRVSACPVGNDEVSRTGIGELNTTSDLHPDTVCRVLLLVWAYRLVNV